MERYTLNKAGWIVVAPFMFVILWSSGFIGAKFGLPYSEPFTFLFLRMFLALAPLGLLLLIVKPKWPNRLMQYSHITVAGLLMHAVYPGGVFVALKSGLPAGVVAVIVGLQPVLTTVLAGLFLSERTVWQQWIGLMLGIAGVCLVIIGQGTIQLEHLTSNLYVFPIMGIGAAFVALIGISFGTIYQKKLGRGVDVLATSFIQHIGAAIAFGIVTVLLSESMQVQWTSEFVFALSWLVIVMSIGAVGLLLLMIRSGEASRVASIFFLVPPITALEAYIFLDESLSNLAILGLGLTAIAVALSSGILVRPAHSPDYKSISDIS